MYYHIEKELYIKVDVELKTFNKTLRRKLNEINVPKNKAWIDITKRENKFIRLSNNGSYIDLEIRKILFSDNITIMLGDIIDFDRQKQHKYINKKTLDTCLANTIQEAATILKINVRHIKRHK